VHAAGTALDLGFVPVTLEDLDIVLVGNGAMPRPSSLVATGPHRQAARRVCTA
jgi:hypothetical protein